MIASFGHLWFGLETLSKPFSMGVSDDEASIFAYPMVPDIHSIRPGEFQQLTSAHVHCRMCALLYLFASMLISEFYLQNTDIPQAYHGISMSNQCGLI